MWAFFVTPLGRRIAIGAGITLAVAFALRWYGNRQWYAGREDGKAAIAEDLEREVTKARNEERARLKAERDQLALERQSLADGRAQLERDRQSVDRAVIDRLYSIEESLRNENLRVTETPDSGLADLVRTLNRELRAGSAAPRGTSRDGGQPGGVEGGPGANPNP
jgi:hypothetical protein